MILFRRSKGLWQWLIHYNVTDLIKVLPGNSSVNTVQHATIEEAVFSVDPTGGPIGWLNCNHVICVYCRSMSVPRLYKWVAGFVQGSYELRVSSCGRSTQTRGLQSAGILQASSGLEECRRVQKVGLWKFYVWLRDFMCAVARLCWKCVISWDFCGSCVVGPWRLVQVDWGD
jgi:hypothetical protein